MTAGGNHQLHLDVANNGPSDAANVVVTDTLPAGVTFVSVTPSNGGWTCNNNAQHLGHLHPRHLGSGIRRTTITIVVTAPDQAAR